MQDENPQTDAPRFVEQLVNLLPKMVRVKDD